MRLLVYIIVILSAFKVEAGELYLCKSYSVKGGPAQNKEEWKAKTDKICIAYHHDTYFPESAIYKLSIAKRVEKYFFARFINKEMKVDKGANWSVFYTSINEPGDYVISVIDDCGQILGEHYCVIK